MALTYHYHPLASFCWKALIALYENDTPFETVLVDPADEQSRAAFLKLSPLGKMPVLHDDGRNRTIPESSIIIEYLGRHYPGATRFLPEDPDLDLQTRLRDRFYDLYVHDPMQRVVADRLRPADRKDSYGVEQEKTKLRNAYAIIEREMASNHWAMGDDFTLADCAAAPALFYANKVEPFGEAHGHVAQYLGRLMQRPSFARVVEEAQPYFRLFPQEP
ncbi:glutathione S-transferase family protein [Pseudaminobacter arsenicus]|uniref:Glutathione S-transferase family protein n=1 Tax=Borborobacter arsenicus TaxID=1851146 RepID=A0A432V974_9HYPH|nr:glutathione S-transferase family protein [Pseudaminobacter arsenicus]RUM98714.1 glutathione S-transferase family protein [Pseudaminobacter arsenicus]